MRVLLSREDLKTLYRLTNPKLSKKPRLVLVAWSSGGEWIELNGFMLRGYRACQTHLASAIERFERGGHWPKDCDVGIGVYKDECLTDVLRAVDRATHNPARSADQPPLDDILAAMGLGRKDVDP